jgi:hypothetical protein
MEMIDLKNINKNNYKTLNKEKKELLKNLIGSASSNVIDFNKIRDFYKHGDSEDISIDENKYIKTYKSLSGEEKCMINKLLGDD